MKHIDEPFRDEPYTSGSWELYTQGFSSAFLDIETTGLSPSRNSVILGGLLNPCAPRVSDGHLYQWLADSPGEEKELLDNYCRRLSSADIWITYNGDSFDLPFLAKRLRQLGVGQSLPFHYSMDLYRLLSRYWPMAKLLPNLKQITVEDALGLRSQRTDLITGKESAALYEIYASDCQKHSDLAKAILLHNQDDLHMLSRLLPVLSKLDLHRIMFENGFIVGQGEKRILIEKISLRHNILEVRGHSRGLAADGDAYLDTYSWKHRVADNAFSLSVPCHTQKTSIFVDLEVMDMNFSPLEPYPAYVSGYLLLRSGSQFYFREINHMIKIILTEILKKF